MKILLGDFSAKVRKGDILKLTIGNERLHKISNDDELRLKLVRLITMCLNETYSKVRIDKHLSECLPFQNVLKQGDTLSQLLFNFALEYTIRKAQENKVGLKLNWTHKLLAYTDDLNLLGNNIDTIKKNTVIFIDASKEAGLEISIGKTKYMLLSRHQNVNQKWDIKIANRSFGNVSQFVYLEMTVTNQNLIQEKIKRRLNSGNACCHLAQNLLSSCLLSKNLKIRINKTIILPLVVYGHGTWSLTLRD
jgi:hypothetical protein